MYINSQLSTCVGTQSPKYIEMAQGHISLSLTPPCEGPFIIAKILKPGTYKLANDQGEVYSNAWNIEQLRHFYP
jgi:hypothetical protein